MYACVFTNWDTNITIHHFDAGLLVTILTIHCVGNIAKHFLRKIKPSLLKLIISINTS